MEYPGRDRLVTHPHDASLMTFRGHSVLSTLIRAYWSPAASTGQRYVYTGSADGGVYIYGETCPPAAPAPSLVGQVFVACPQ
jgi:WD repeat-containing protein 23